MEEATKNKNNAAWKNPPRNMARDEPYKPMWYVG
jgi:hypothetical protein